MIERCGYVAIVGRPNVGKSTLLNRLIGQKISITSRKPQTTRHRLLGIKTTDTAQIIYVDTPGLHERQHNAMNRYLNRSASASLVGVNVILWVIEALRWTEEDEWVLKILEETDAPVLLLINKVDKFAEKTQLLPFMEQMATKRNFTDVFPISARKGVNLIDLEKALVKLLPEGEAEFPEDQITDRSERFLVAEIVREKLTRHLGAELPYRITVQTEHFADEAGITHISTVIWVERSSQKAIVIGKQGLMLKQIGEDARIDMEKLLDRKVFLQLWVKVKEGWSDDERALRQLGYTDE